MLPNSRKTVGLASATRALLRGVLAAVFAINAPAALADKAAAPIPVATVALMAVKGTGPAEPILLRAFKKESEIELWKRAATGRFVHVKTYPICRWSGQLGPKTRTGDRQTPEGFYTVAKGQLNANSRYYLSFDIGYPNAFDRARGFTGSAIMVHGICSSMGCYAMTDRVAGELFAIARDAFEGGQAAFQFQSFPFRMSAENIARYRTDPHIAFWRQLKEGSDRFEATGLEPVVTVAGGRYAYAPLREPGQEALALQRVREENARIASLVEDGAGAVRTTYADGGQHPFWAALIRKGFPVGQVSRPEALAFAGQDVVVIPERPKPAPLPETVWAALIAPGTRFGMRHAAGFVPEYEVPPSRFAAPAASLPLILGATLKGEVPSPVFEDARTGIGPVAQR